MESAPPLSWTFLMPYIEKFHEMYPNVEIQINNNLSNNLIKELRKEGKLPQKSKLKRNKTLKELLFGELLKIVEILNILLILVNC